MRYVDLHCDTLTKSFDTGNSPICGDLQTTIEKLNMGGCAVQCFAIFTQGANTAHRFKEYLGFYRSLLKEHAIKAVLNYSDFEKCLNGKEAGAILTVENLGFIEELSELSTLAKEGVKMASLVWNFENHLARPNLIFDGENPRFDKRNKEGLTPLGKSAAELLDSLKIIIDISHLSDGGVDELLNGRKKPLVASHSNCASVFEVSRNLTDAQIKKIADCGGVVGVNFCKDFLGDGDTFGCVLNHINHLIKVGGEDIIAFGSDFDGIPAPPRLCDCTRMPNLINYLEKGGITGERLEKLCYKNFARVFKEICG